MYKHFISLCLYFYLSLFLSFSLSFFCKQALASMLTPMNTLRVEYGVLSNSEAVLDPIIASAKNS